MNHAKMMEDLDHTIRVIAHHKCADPALSLMLQQLQGYSRTTLARLQREDRNAQLAEMTRNDIEYVPTGDEIDESQEVRLGMHKIGALRKSHDDRWFADGLLLTEMLVHTADSSLDRMKADIERRVREIRCRVKMGAAHTHEMWKDLDDEVVVKPARSKDDAVDAMAKGTSCLAD